MWQQRSLEDGLERAAAAVGIAWGDARRGRGGDPAQIADRVVAEYVAHINGCSEIGRLKKELPVWIPLMLSHNCVAAIDR